MARELRIIVDVETLQAKAELRSLDTAIDANVRKTGQLGEAHEKAGEKLKKTTTIAQDLNKLVMQYVSAAVIGQAIRSTLEYASSLEKMKASTDISYRGLQQLQNIGVSTNTSLTTMTTGVQELTRRLGDGDKSAVNALHRLGIEVEYFKRLSPDQQFITVARALGQVSSDTDKASIAASLFGRAWKELLPTFTTDIDKFKTAVHIMSDNQIADIARVQQKIDEFILSMKRYGVQAGSNLFNTIAHPMTPATDPNGWMDRSTPLGKGDVMPFIDRPDPTALVGAWLAKQTGRPASAPGMYEAQVALDLYAKQDTARQAAAAKAAADNNWIYDGMAYGPSSSNLTMSRDFSGAVMYGPGSLPSAFNPVAGAYQIGNGMGYGPTSVAGTSSVPQRTGLFSGANNGAFASAAMGGVGAAMGGGGAGSAFMSLGMGGGTALASAALAPGAMAAGTVALGATTLGIGAAAIGAYYGIKKILANGKEGREVSPKRDADFARMGGLETLNPKIQALTGNLQLVDNLFKSKTIEQYNGAMAQLHALEEQVNADLQTATELYGDISGKMERLTELSPELGKQIQLALEAKTPADFATALGDVNGVLDEQALKHRQLDELAAKYGFTLSEMGPKFAQGKLDEMSKILIDDWKLLTSNGNVTDDMLKKMSGSFQDLVTNALKTGSEIPNALKGPIERLAKMGLLTDDAGNKMEDLSQLKFSDTLENHLKDVKDALDGLKRVLEELPGKFALVASSATTELGRIPSRVDVEVHTRRTYDDNTGGDVSSHGGSIIRPWGLERFHSGGLLPDERTIVAQTGEGILSRRGMATLGAKAFHALNRGESSSDGTQVTIMPGAVVVHSVIESPAERRRLSDAIAEDLMRDIQNRTRVNR